MQKNFKKSIPHLIAIATFFIVAYLFSKPAFEGKVLQQHDIVSVKGMEKNALEYKEKFGTLPLWNTNLFSGMPNFQVLIEGPKVINLLTGIFKVVTLGLPRPANFFFLACICFYLLCIALRCNPYIGIFGALAYAYSTYNPVIISAGHETKMMAIAFAPALFAGLIWLFEKKYWIGFAVTSLFATMEVISNHPQINYYMFIAAAFMTVSYMIQWVKNKEWKHMLIALGLAAIAGTIGILNSATTFFTTSDYSKYTMRGGKTIETTNTGQIVQKKTTGLDKDYAFRYSFDKAETTVLLMPDAFGGSSSQTLDENSHVVDKLVNNNIPEASAMQIASSLPKYWGGMSGPGESTSGPPYLGVISSLLFIIGLVVVKSNHKWWIAAATVFTIFMAWGKYFPAFNNILFDLLPMYSKFRAPSMALVVPQLLVPFLAVLTLQWLLFSGRVEETLSKNFKPVLYALGGLVLLLGILYFMNDYKSPIDKEITAAYSSSPGGDEISRMIITGLSADRKDMFGGGILRVLGFAVFIAALLFLRRKKIFSSLVAVIILTIVNSADLFIVGKKYLNDENNYIEADTYTDYNFKPTQADALILRDKDPHFRVFNLSPDRFNESRTSYYHRSIGGYHAAKLRIYQDLIEAQLSKPELNMPVLNMLDTKYFLIPDQQNNTLNVQKNDNALGAVWFVKQLQQVNGPIEEIKALDNFNPSQTAFIDKAQNYFMQPAADSSATINLVKYTNDEIVYASESKSDQFAVFSEIYYSAGWNAYIDGKKTPYYKVDYLLRGMPVPAGKHSITFKFEPKSYYTGYTLATWANILLYIILIGCIYMSIRKKELTYSLDNTTGQRV